MTQSTGEAHRPALEFVARGVADQSALGARLTPKERTAVGEPDAWSAKDHVAHNNFWRMDSVRRLRAALEGGTPPELAEDDVENDRVFRAHRDVPWNELIAE